jgi:hypothetical protein
MGVTARDQRETIVTYASSPVALADRVFAFGLHFS